MGKWCSLVFSLLFFFPLFHGGIVAAAKAQEGLEEWGYVEVRPKAHMFWWLYRSPYRVEDDPSSKPWPIILWLQGGPGASGVGIGNFEEIGPIDSDLKPRNSTWLRKADLLFVDNQIGTGYSFVEDEELLVKTDEEAAVDLTTLLEEIFNRNESLQKSPLHIVAESYGGKYAVTLALSALKAIEAGKLKLKLGGDSWISQKICGRNLLICPIKFSWGPLLKDISRLALKIKQHIEQGLYVDATNSWMQLESVVSSNSNNVDFYNFLLDFGSDSMTEIFIILSSLRSSPGGVGDLGRLMNGVIKKKLKIIPENVEWEGQSETVFTKLVGEFMKPRIGEVDELLAKGVNVTVYNGQVRSIINTSIFSTMVLLKAWIEKLKGFFKSYKNLHFYGFLEQPLCTCDQPCVALNMSCHHAPSGFFEKLRKMTTTSTNRKGLR
ncbi:hypothetical protein I3842_Q105600 [Carya illinoinensis]|uniref:Carboxypeptidase n=1 Tax=Carya illinoinensis TaxID=32201 RepID=A0A921ZXV9_CARIL|nr:hypothetical protein I3842_Q105600 [Carya illinoinensis]